MEIKKITDQNHDEIVKSNKIVLLKFGAEWCGPCRMISSELKELAETNPDIVVGEADIDSPETDSIKQKYDIQTIPHIALLVDGKIVDSFKGYKPKVVMQEMVDKVK